MRKIALIGGDCRQIHAAAALQKAGFSPFVYGNDMAATAGFTAPYTLKETLENAEAVLFPVPSMQKEGVLYTPFFEKPLSVQTVMEELPKDIPIFLWGKEKFNIQQAHVVIDLSKDNICLEENAKATAHAALFLAINHSQKALFRCTAAVVGYGRIGKELATALSQLGANVRVGARREESRLAADAKGYKTALPTDTKLFSEADLVFNTVPSPILSARMLGALAPGAVYLELASPPYGLTEDQGQAQRLG